MKRRDFIKKTGLWTAGIVTAEFMFPSKSFGLEDVVSGRIIDTLSENPVSDAEVNINGEKYTTDIMGYYNNIPVGVNSDLLSDVKKLYNNNPEFDELRKVVL